MAISKEEEKRIEALAISVLRDYHVNRPPVPVEKILSDPPKGLERVDISDLSLVFGVGEHRHEYRLALGRLLYRELCRTQTGPDPVPYSSDAARQFSLVLLMPTAWITAAARRPLVTLRHLSETFEVPEYAVASRLVQVGQRVRGMD
jgi:hypothetical protein